ncbi:hypothetical protein Bca4012_099119 [Brassica carinata]
MSSLSHRRVEDVDPSGGEGYSCRELARAILKLGEVYERIEGAKQLMMIELEKQRICIGKKLQGLDCGEATVAVDKGEVIGSERSFKEIVFILTH